jgi:hypothetical protein
VVNQLVQSLTEGEGGIGNRCRRIAHGRTS